MLKDLEVGEIEYESAGEFLIRLKKEVRREDKEVVKVAELRRLE